MASYTTNLNLKKPAGSENVSIGDINNNMDIIDSAIGDMNTGTKGIGIKHLYATDDLDNAYPANEHVGFFVATQNAPHIPTTAWYFIMAFRGESNYITQVAFNMTGSLAIYMRQYSIGTTGAAWTKMNA